MNRKAVRAFIPFVVILATLCAIWSFVTEDKIGENYIFVFLFEPFVVYIPLGICTVGVLLGFISFFFQERTEKRLRIFSLIAVGFGFLFSIVSLILIGTSTNRDEMVHKNSVAEQKYQVQNFAETPILEEDTLYNQYIGSNYIAIGNHFAYHTEKEYVCNDDDLFSLEISAYEFENVPRLFRRRMKNYFTDEYFRWRTRIGYYDGKTFTGENSGKDYTYYLSVHEDEKRNFSYFAILAEDDNSVSLLMLSTYYTENYNIDISKIIETMCSE